MTQSESINKLSVKTQTIGCILAIIASITLPQALHLIGSISGMGTSLGETFLPMHLPVILAGFLAGPYAAVLAGSISPVLSFLMTGMPAASMLPFMIIELSVYGISAGFLKNVHIPCIIKVLCVQLSGRLVRAAAILIGYNLFGTTVRPAVIYSSLLKGLMGIILQLTIIPLVVYRLREADNE